MTAGKPSHLVPKLRFPEFVNMLKWKQCQIKNILDYEQPGKYIVENFNFQDNGIPVLTANKSFLLGYTFEKYGIYENIPVIIFDDFTVDLKYVDFPFKIKSSAIKILTNSKNNDLKFIYELMSCIKFDSTQHQRYYISQYQNLSVSLPSKAEQRKIADCLGSLDDLIAAEGRKLEALRKHKQGLMQQLFPQPGKTLPRLRFLEFEKEPEWDNLLLSSISNVNPPNDELPELFIYIDLESVKSGMLVERKKIDRDTAPIRAQRLLRRKDIIYQTVRPYQRNNLLFDTEDGSEYVASTGYAQLRAYGCPEFLYQLLHTASFINSVLARCTGSNYPAINSSDLASIHVALPGHPEQQKIADCLGSLDDLIAAEGRKLEALRWHKQGLLQQLFPSLESQ